MTRHRLTFTFDRTDVAAQVAAEALRRGCDVQAVINSVLARHFIERPEQRLAEQLEIVQGALRHLTSTPATRPLAPAPPVEELPAPVPVPRPLGERRKNAWE